ncbi:MAG TPA: hypothetical protein PLV58_11975, partial [Campylobacterales bacterium]|nr:hypothetical protein [Campylobacterales bacterium]
AVESTISYGVSLYHDIMEQKGYFIDVPVIEHLYSDVRYDKNGSYHTAQIILSGSEQSLSSLSNLFENGIITYS